MNDETKRSRMRAGVIGASVAVAVIGAIVVVVTNKDSDEDERVSSVESKRDAQFPGVEPGVAPVVVETPGPKWEREPRNVRDTRKDDPALARQQAIEQARNAGILGKATLQQGGAFASLTGTGGLDDQNIYGGLLGSDNTQPGGGFGYGNSGSGSGGGGTGWGTIGTGRYGSIGNGSGTGTGYGVGGGRIGRASGPVVMLAPPNVVAVQGDGSLDKAIVRRYLKRNIAKLTYCYEKQLLAKPALAGTVQIQFKILDTGHVTAGTATGVDPDVASCVGGVVSAIEFPKPKGSGGVQVNVSLTVRPK